MDSHTPYEERIKRKPDFRVKYRFYSIDEGGRYSFPYQGIRSDFWYEHSEHKTNGQSLFIIWPEFENEKEEVIIDRSMPVPKTGTARMWIINDEFIPYHKGKIELGTKGFFKEGSRSTGECEVIELINIAE
ncbi:hypothetical protein WBG78_19400 [Chryseolinea sp. T2]|uniref:hypothetical protein n=1 Tax=Chryseolinea sp. T2 TaxID=3129255 RepID=UPI0030782E61